MMKQLRKIINTQGGFSMIEMLVAIAISGLIIGLIVDVTAQTLVINAADNSRMAAVKQVENAIHWIERDGQMASSKSIDSTATQFPLELRWTGFENGYTHFITYDVNNGELSRHEVVKDISEPENKEVISETETFICDNIVDAGYAFDGKILEVNLTAHVSDYRSATETRTLYVIPRVGKEAEEDD
jgi:prepilin-type N-terminal cleavage/methylation domain-containing protein